MTVTDFIAKWRHVDLTERSSSQTHFLDLCRLVGHPDPVSADPQGQWFTFERGAAKATGGDGWADVWKREYFGWEYKGRHRNLEAAYGQLLLYQGALENPPLLVTCDTDRILIHTHFPNTPTVIHELTLDGLLEDAQFAKLRAVFHEPERLRPTKTIQAITEEAAGKITQIAQNLRGREIPPKKVARFLDRVVFCLFAEDTGLLPDRLFTKAIENTRRDPARFRTIASSLFQAMAVGGDFGAERIAHFNGDVFTDAEALDLTVSDLTLLAGVTAMDWSAIDPSIFGTLFERALDPDKRSQLGAHYTSREDIELLVDPVVVEPLKREWANVRAQVSQLLVGSPTTKQHKKAQGHLREFLGRLQDVTVLDPACGSGNFLYVTLQKLKDLEKEVIVFAAGHHFGFFPGVGPWQLRGIELNPYAFELAQMTVQIGYLQWVKRNGFGQPEEPILRSLDTFECKDSILDLQPDSVVAEPTWPDAEFIVGNPPFLGVRRLRDNLGDEYVEGLFTLWDGRVPAEADYCCYWFEKARAQVRAGKAKRVGLLATQGIRFGASRQVLEKIKETGDIFFAISDREWVLDGATVHVSMVGFDDGSQTKRAADGALTGEINSDLSTGADVTTARVLPENARKSFMADTKGGAFDVTADVATPWLLCPNPTGRPNSDILRPWVNGLDMTRRPRGMWIVDFPPGTTRETAAGYEAAFEYLTEHVLPVRKGNRRAAYAERWWLHVEGRPDMRLALAPYRRFLGTPSVSKHRLFFWLNPEVLADHALIVFATEDDYDFGILHSRAHEVWARSQGSQLREVESGFRYTPTSTFETFPFPVVSVEARAAISILARDLDGLRSRWLNPPEWTREEAMSFPASLNGPWRHLIESPNTAGIGTATYRRVVPVDDDAAKALSRRTLTALYNDPPTWLRDRHAALDAAVLSAYGLPSDADDQGILSHLLALNLERSSRPARAKNSTLR
jgi:type II restriction/modification system DNA methylase subunit YeeA